MRKILTSFSLVAASLAFAQVGINADENDIAKDAVFHVKNMDSEAKGVILPSVALKSSTDQTTITGANGSVTTGLMVWNDGTAGLEPVGYYYWDGAKWLLTGNVEAEASSPFLGGTKGNIRLVELPVASDDWKDDDFALVVSGHGTIGLPNPGGNNAGRIISVNNQGTSARNFGANPPLNLNTIDAGTGMIIMSNGSNWYVIGGLY